MCMSIDKSRNNHAPTEVDLPRRASLSGAVRSGANPGDLCTIDQDRPIGERLWYLGSSAIDEGVVEKHTHSDHQIVDVIVSRDGDALALARLGNETVIDLAQRHIVAGQNPIGAGANAGDTGVGIF